MAQYNYHFDGQNEPNPGFTSPVMTGEVQHSVLEAYIWMFAGLGLTGLVAMAFAKFGWTYQMLVNMPMLAYLLPVLQIVLVMVFSFRMAKASPATLKGLFLAYSLTMGISLSSLFYVYTDGALYMAFFISALYYGCLVIIGLTTKKDLTKLGTLAITALVVMLISQLVMMLFRVNPDTRLMAIAGLLIFTGITAWDVQRLNKTMLYAQGQPLMQQKWAIYFALELYLDFINIFLYIVRLLGSNSSNRR